jgi:hypothetical protein
MQKEYPWLMPSPNKSWSTKTINSPISNNPNLVSTVVDANTNSLGTVTGTTVNGGTSGWYTIENIWVARGWIISGGQAALIPIGPYGSAAATPNGNVRQATGYLYYYGSGTSTDNIGLHGFTNINVSNSRVHNTATLNGSLKIISAQNTTSFSSGMWVQVEWVQGYVDSEGYSVPSGIDYPAGHKWAKQLRFCDFPGHKLIKNIQFTVNNNILDQYDTEIYTTYEKFLIKPEKRVGYLKLIGQQQPIDAYGEENYTGARQMTTIVNGNQVPTTSLAGNTFLWVPLLFWFSKDFRLSIPSVSIPFGQRNIDVTLAPLTDLVYAVPGKVFRLHKTKKY